jgi:hypothetical protein
MSFSGIVTANTPLNGDTVMSVIGIHVTALILPVGYIGQTTRLLRRFFDVSTVAVFGQGVKALVSQLG